MIGFRSASLAEEFQRLRWRNQPLALLVDNAAAYMAATFRKPVRISCIHRSLGVQRREYAGGTKKVDPRAALATAILREVLADGADPGPVLARLHEEATPHLFWEAVDLEDAPYAPREVAGLLGYLRGFDRHNRLPEIRAAGSRTAWLHTAGSKGSHLHIQYHGPPVHRP